MKRTKYQNEELERYMEAVGGPLKAAERLEINSSLLYNIRQGRRRVTADLAQKIWIDARGKIDRIKLLYEQNAA